jgi:hypothetical protein
MDIDLDGVYFLRMEDLNVILGKKVTITGENARGKAPKAENIGQEREKTLGYFGQVVHALQYYCDRVGRNAETIHGVRDAWFAAVERIEVACAGIKSNGTVAAPVAPAPKKKMPPMGMQDKTKVLREAVSIMAAAKAAPQVLAGAPESMPPLTLPPPPFP